MNVRSIAASLAARLALLCVALGVAACGGGSDLAANRVTLPIGGSTSGSGSGTGTSSGGSGQTVTAQVQMSLVDASSGQSTLALSAKKLTSLRVQVRDATGAPVANALVRFSASDAALVAFSPAASALTDANGAASVNVGPASSASAGAVTLVATALVAQTVATSSLDVAVSGGQTAVAQVQLSLVDVATGQPTLALSTTKLTSLRAQVRDTAGAPVANTVVRFTASDAALVAFTPAASALTDGTGVAAVNVAPASITSAGALTLVATAQVAQAVLASSLDVAIGATQVTLAALQLGQSSISAYGTTVASVQVSGVPANTPVTVRFMSACAAMSPARATITPQVVTNNGIARATYVDKGCGGVDVVTASVDGTSATSTASLTVAAPAVANIQFVGASPERIATRGTGGVGLSEVSSVKFRVVDQSSNPYPTPTNVTLELSSNTGGITIDQAAGPVVRQTDANGEVSVLVQSGNLPAPVWVIATIRLQDRVFTSNSNVLSVTTGQPIQSKFSVSIDRPNIEGWSYDGQPAVIMAIAADIFGTPVPDRTVVNFVGDLVPAACQTGVDGPSGVCRVTFLSQGTRPANGRLPVVAYAVGEESFDDANGNFQYDSGERFYELGDLWLDRNENGRRDQSEGVIPFASASQVCVNPDPAFPNLTTRDGGLGACDGVRGRSFVRGQVIVVLSGSFGFFRSSPVPGSPTIPTSYSLGASCSTAIGFWLQDLHGNPMPADTKISADASAARGLTATVAGDTVGASVAVGGTYHVVRVLGALDATGACVGVGPVIINTKTPIGNITSFTVDVGP